ncbi:MAG: 1-acyl-sn-glycerol-3-phosphate acyltransferase [Pseudomonadota bacterium]|nr:1-acyl-sn-glycerol-3-phosphate acyltransferase [Pseudomonadota bacterium]
MAMATHALNRRRDGWLWRLFATAASFAAFGIGGLILRVLILPMFALLPGGPTARRRRARAAISRSFYLLVQFMFRTRVLDFHIDGTERLGRPGQLIIANHPSLIDVVFLISQIRDTNCVVKASLWNNPCMHGAVRAAQYISNNGSADMLEQAAGVLREGQTLVMFPEGTRTTPGQPPVFHRGAAAIALRGARVITPVHISVSPTTLTKAERWYHIPWKRVAVHLRVGEDIDPAAFKHAPMPIASRQLNQHLHHLFLEGHHDL